MENWKGPSIMYGETTKTSPRSFFAVVIVIVGLVCFIIIFRKTYCSFMQSDNDHFSLKVLPTLYSKLFY